MGGMVEGAGGDGGWGGGGGGEQEGRGRSSSRALQTSWLQQAISVGDGLLCLSRETGVNLCRDLCSALAASAHLKVNKWFMAA